MQTTIRTTIRIRKDLLNQFRLLALKEGNSLQNVINNTLALGLGKVTDLEFNKKAMTKIDNLRMSLSGQEIDLKKLLSKNKSDLK